MQKGFLQTPGRRGSFSEQLGAGADIRGLTEETLSQKEEKHSPADVSYQFRPFMTPESAKMEKGSDGYETPKRDHRVTERNAGSLFYVENVSDGDITVTNMSSPDSLAEWPSETIPISSQLSKKFLANHAECSHRCPSGSPLAAGLGDIAKDPSGLPVSIVVSSIPSLPVHPAGSDVPVRSGTREWCESSGNGSSRKRSNLGARGGSKRCCLRIALCWSSLRRAFRKAIFGIKTKTSCGYYMAQCILRLQYLQWIGVLQVGCVVVFLTLLLFLCLNPLGINMRLIGEKGTQGDLSRRSPIFTGNNIKISPGFAFYSLQDGENWPDLTEGSDIIKARPLRNVSSETPPSGLSRNWAPRLLEPSVKVLTDGAEKRLHSTRAGTSSILNDDSSAFLLDWKEAPFPPDGSYQDANHIALASNKENVLSRMLKNERFTLTWGYLLEEKDLPYVGSEVYFQQLFPVAKPILERDVIDEHTQDENQKMLYTPPESIAHHYYNTLAVFAYQDDGRRHGRLGVSNEGIVQYVPTQLPLTEDSRSETVESNIRALGYDLELLSAIPLDRQAVDHRSAACRAVAASNERNASYLLGLEDVSIVIAFRNTPMAALLRTLHSVLNRTPPALLREIILVDDASNATPIFRRGGFLHTYIKKLPKVKLMVMPQRKGLSFARSQGVFISTAPVVAILAPFLEVNEGWLEPMLQELKVNGKAVVYPRILPINPRTFALEPEPEFGCPLGFNWHMRETPGPLLPPEATNSVSSPMLPSQAAFVMHLDSLKRIGLFDTEFSADNFDNVDLALRTWQCGGNVVCSPCSIVYVVPIEPAPDPSISEDVQRLSRLRIAKLWTDNFYPLVGTLLRPSFSVSDTDLGRLDKTLDLKKKLQCKSFDWYLQQVAPMVLPRTPQAFDFWGTIRVRATGSSHYENSVRCLDGRRYETADKQVELRPCHGFGDSQVFFTTSEDGEGYSRPRGTFALRFGLVPTLCLGHDMRLRNCNQEAQPPEGTQPRQNVAPDKFVMWMNKTESRQVQSVGSSLCWTARVAQVENAEPERLTDTNSSPPPSGKRSEFNESQLDQGTLTWGTSDSVDWKLSADVCTTSPPSEANALQQWHWVPEAPMDSVRIGTA